jgi:hypothetical protein
MKKDSVRTTVDIPGPLYRKLKQQANSSGRSIRELLVTGAEQVILRSEAPKRRRARLPIIRSKGPKVDLTNEMIYELIEFP